MKERFNLSLWAINHSQLIWFLIVMTIIAGSLSYNRLGRNEDPVFVIKTMLVQIRWPGANIDDTMNQVTDRIEKKLQEITKTISPCDIAYRRGDIRFFLLQFNKSKECNTFGWFLLHLPKQDIYSYLEKYTQTTFIGEVITQALFLFQSIECLDAEDILSLLSFADTDILSIRPLSETLHDFTAWILQLRVKFDF